MIITGARTTGLVESPLLSNGHGGFGEAARGNGPVERLAPRLGPTSRRQGQLCGGRSPRIQARSFTERCSGAGSALPQPRNNDGGRVAAAGLYRVRRVTGRRPVRAAARPAGAGRVGPHGTE